MGYNICVSDCDTTLTMAVWTKTLGVQLKAKPQSSM